MVLVSGFEPLAFRLPSNCSTIGAKPARNSMNCLQCQQPLERSRQKFCNHSCRAIYQNSHRPKKYQCVVCNKDVPHYLKYCSTECRNNAKDIQQRFINGEFSSRKTLRRLVIERDGYKCSECSITEWREFPLSLELDHKDGDASNNKADNLHLLCPNCHSITPTWKARNKGNGRKSLGLCLG